MESRKQRARHERRGLQDDGDGDPQVTGLDWSRLESSGSDFKIIKLIEVRNIFECVWNRGLGLN